MGVFRRKPPPPTPPPGAMEAIARAANKLSDAAAMKYRALAAIGAARYVAFVAPLRERIRTMTPSEHDLAVLLVFALIALVAQFAVVMCVKIVLAVWRKIRRKSDDVSPGAHAAGMAWMNAAGVTHPDDVCVAPSAFVRSN